MNTWLSKIGLVAGWSFGITRRIYNCLAKRSFSVIISGALLCTLLVKLLQSLRIGQLSHYPQWVLADIAVLLGIEVILSALCFFRPRRWTFRLATIIAAIICVWAFINAGWLLRTGKQFLPLELFPLIRDPYTTIAIVAINMIKMPVTAILLLSPVAAGITFLAMVLARPKLPTKNYTRFIGKTSVCVVLIITSIAVYAATAQEQSGVSSSQELRYNSHLKSVTTGLLNESLWEGRDAASTVRHTIPNIEQAAIEPPQKTAKPYNIVVIVLEGVQYRHTSLYDKSNNLTPYLQKVADEGVEFTSARSSFTHTTKALFALISGRHPSPSQDITETIPVNKPYLSLASVLKDKQNYRSAFFQSAKGEFESAPGLMHNLGFDKFWARECLCNSESFLGYQSCDEFTMLRPMSEWMKSDDKPFLLMIMCSVSHDPYIVPKWFAAPAKEPIKRYRQTINYTDSFIKAVDCELAKLNLTDNTIFCIISDHGEGFGEHGLFAHEGIGFEESMRVPWVIRAPGLVKAGNKINEPISSIDLAPTLLTMLGFSLKRNDFEGDNILGEIPADRKVFFVGGMYYGPTGYIKDNIKYIYDEVTDTLSAYNLKNDPSETRQIILSPRKGRQIADEIKQWGKEHILQADKNHSGKITVYDDWVIKWGNTICRTKYKPQPAFVKAQ
jgi:glucan phosphoethanolaminetransferase (alkaline phosphatase superfamily)